MNSYDNKRALNAPEAVKDSPEIAQLKNDIAAEEKTLFKHYAALGIKYYRRYKEIPEAEFSDIVAAIKKSEAIISDSKKKIEQLNHQIKCSCGMLLPEGSSFCPSCGKAVNANCRCSSCGGKILPGDLFCVWCGARIEDKTKAVPQILRCHKCGTELMKGSRFCTNCGTQCV